jgi:hypothetical protein
MVQQALPAGAPPDEARRRAIALVSGMVGGFAIAGALENADPDLSRDVVAATREELERLAFAPRGEPNSADRHRGCCPKPGTSARLSSAIGGTGPRRAADGAAATPRVA